MSVKLKIINNYNDLKKDDLILLVDNFGREELARVTCIDNNRVWTISVLTQDLEDEIYESFNQLEKRL